MFNVVSTPKSVDAVLAVCFKSGAIYLMSNYDDLHPRIIYTHLKGSFLYIYTAKSIQIIDNWCLWLLLS